MLEHCILAILETCSAHASSWTETRTPAAKCLSNASRSHNALCTSCTICWPLTCSPWMAASVSMATTGIACLESLLCVQHQRNAYRTLVSECQHSTFEQQQALACNHLSSWWDVCLPATMPTVASHQTRTKSRLDISAVSLLRSKIDHLADRPIWISDWNLLRLDIEDAFDIWGWIGNPLNDADCRCLHSDFVDFSTWSWIEFNIFTFHIDILSYLAMKLTFSVCSLDNLEVSQNTSLKNCNEII